MSPTNKSNLKETNQKVRIGPYGYHLFNRTTGINLLIDEIKPPIILWSTAPRQVSIALTNACDLSCPHCYAPKKPAVLDFELVLGWIEDLDANGCVGVGFGGGEPTLYPRLAELCEYTTKRTNMAIIMTTHGHRLNDRLLSELAGNLHFIRVSMDGVGKTYESIRGRSFDELIKRIKAIKEVIPFGINYLVNSITYNDIDNAIAIADELGASEFLLIPEVSVRDSNGIDKITTEALREWVYKYRGNIRLSVSEGGKEGLPTCNPFKDETNLLAFAHIDASGLLKRTSYDIEGIEIREDGVMVALDQLKKSIKR